ncbi:drug/metabolite transporter superfamily protein YnfA [Arthrobacter sp. OAP107]
MRCTPVSKNGPERSTDFTILVHRGGIPRFGQLLGYWPQWRPGSAAPAMWKTGRNTGAMTILKSVLLFTLAAVAEIGGAWLIWQAVREDKAWWWAGLGIVALGLYGFVAAFQPDAHFGRVLAAYGGVFIVGSLVWGMLLDGFRPDRWDLIGAAVCLVGVAVIMFAPRQG